MSTHLICLFVPCCTVQPAYLCQPGRLRLRQLPQEECLGGQRQARSAPRRQAGGKEGAQLGARRRLQHLPTQAPCVHQINVDAAAAGSAVGGWVGTQRSGATNCMQC